MDMLKISANLALNHHEKYNGTGYPNGIKGDEILLEARMLSIIDVFDAMTHKRVYKDAFSVDEALEYIKSQKGKHFDPNLVDVFMENIEEILDIEE
ncbi:HD-GYP domain-containing protein (c-di-GMP phosphodiesterase class II) [Acetoanaerobium pronyense]|uniref:HD-GYP domain-containing protein (C-di-GMP phosphodiesterase class II) n=1 Tax=Acetoanaerobium pronyense TaxID=1482736 RepID=A0ABS4KMT5_9FIRM|nr:HD-GYP domain-containing protein (c-di-GMP phosphodiesterase class II) [Acetoanaerobium pronyense]